MPDLPPISAAIEALAVQAAAVIRDNANSIARQCEAQFLKRANDEKEPKASLRIVCEIVPEGGEQWAVCAKLASPGVPFNASASQVVKGA